MSDSGILVVTMGITWQVVPELLGFTNAELNYYADHPDRGTIEALREECNITPVSEVRVITTGGKLTDDSVGQLEEWSRLVSGINIKTFRLRQVEELANVQECRYMAEYIYRIVLKSTEESNSVYLSLAGGRKTMSADMQRAANLFGCAGLLHVVDRFMPREHRDKFNKFSFERPLPSDLAGCVMPLVVSGALARDPVLDVGTTVESTAYPAGEVGDCSTKLLDEVDRRVKDAANLLRNFTADLLKGEHSGNFRALYSLPPAVIDRLRSRSFDYSYVKRLPKAELHCHFGGIASPAEMIEIAAANDISRVRHSELKSFLSEVRQAVEASDLPQLRELVPEVKALRSRFGGLPEPLAVAGFIQQFSEDTDLLEEFIFGDSRDEPIGIERYEALGDLQGSGLMQSESSIRACCRILARQCLEHNVRYIEVRCSPVNYTRGGLLAERVVSIMMEEFAKQKETFFNLLFIASRHGRMSDVYRHIELAQTLLAESSDFRKFFAGFDLAGAEGRRSPHELREAFMPLMKECLSLTIHAGETESAENIWEAVYHLNADRIGHGLKLIEMPELMDKFRNRKISIEMCPTSNRQIVGFEPDSDYPLKKYLESGLKVCVNTDNPGISRTDFSAEYMAAAELSRGGLSRWQLLQLIRNSFNAAFVDYAKRRALILAAEKTIMEIVTGG